MRARAFATGAALAVSTLVASDTAAQRETSAVTRLLAYADRFEQEFGSVVAEEHYEQFFRGPLIYSGPTKTVLRSDFLFVQLPDGGWLPFRDVFERDGTAVRDRRQRLEELFLAGSRNAVEQAIRIAAESARYNIGPVERTINLPTLPMMLLTTKYRHRFAVSSAGSDEHGAVVLFKEIGRPTVIQSSGLDLPANGRYWIDATTGVVRRTELNIKHVDVQGRTVVTYGPTSGIPVWVPVRMEERYKPARDPRELLGVATYSKMRRFQVKTHELLKP